MENWDRVAGSFDPPQTAYTFICSCTYSAPYPMHIQFHELLPMDKEIRSRFWHMDMTSIIICAIFSGVTCRQLLHGDHALFAFVLLALPDTPPHPPPSQCPTKCAGLMPHVLPFQKLRRALISLYSTHTEIQNVFGVNREQVCLE